jgi:hypothetical protein
MKKESRDMQFLKSQPFVCDQRLGKGHVINALKKTWKKEEEGAAK